MNFALQNHIYGTTAISWKKIDHQLGKKKKKKKNQISMSS